MDRAHQIVIDAQAHGTGAEPELLVPVVTALQPVLAPTTLRTADAGYPCAANLRHLAEQHIEALIADHAMRQRDERFATQAQHQATPDPRYDKTKAVDEPRVVQPTDFTYDAAARTCVCPAGKALYRSGRDIVTRGDVADHCRGAKGSPVSP